MSDPHASIASMSETKGGESRFVVAGRARSLSQTAAERRELARQAAEARWGVGMARETHSGELHLPGLPPIPCAVLDSGLRVLTTRGFSRAFGYRKTGTDRTGTGAPQLPPFLASKAMKTYLSEDLLVLLKPIEYRPLGGGRTAFGYEARLLPMICRAVVAAWRASALRGRQAVMAQYADAMLNALAGLGMVSLVDEATGFREDRDRADLRRTFELYFAESLRPWSKKFPDAFFEQVYRLHGWTYRLGNPAHPQYLGHFINRYVYGRLPTGVLEGLQVRNPRTEAGSRKHRHHQFLTPDTGDVALDQQILRVHTLMTAASSPTMFKQLIRAACPIVGDQTELDLEIPPPN